MVKLFLCNYLDHIARFERAGVCIISIYVHFRCEALVNSDLNVKEACRLSSFDLHIDKIIILQPILISKIRRQMDMSVSYDTALIEEYAPLRSDNSHRRRTL